MTPPYPDNYQDKKEADIFINEITLPEIHKGDEKFEVRDDTGKLLFSGTITWKGDSATITLISGQGYLFGPGAKVSGDGAASDSSANCIIKQFPCRCD